MWTHFIWMYVYVLICQYIASTISAVLLLRFPQHVPDPDYCPSTPEKCLYATILGTSRNSSVLSELINTKWFTYWMMLPTAFFITPHCTFLALTPLFVSDALITSNITVCQCFCFAKYLRITASVVQTINHCLNDAWNYWGLWNSSMTSDHYCLLFNLSSTSTCNVLSSVVKLP